MEEVDGKFLAGIRGKRTKTIGIANFKPNLLNLELDSEIPFAVLISVDMPCRCILGAKFIGRNNITVDFSLNQIYCDNLEGEELRYPFQHEQEPQNDSSTESLGSTKLILTVSDSEEIEDYANDSELDSTEEDSDGRWK